jgi:Mak10 subunit, NatC N(alpha)-terminal acetyltransferase
LSGVGALKDSQLVHTKTFHYKSAMCASELMDPKMDMGIRQVVSRSIVRTKLESGELSTAFTVAGVHASFDKLFQYEVPT